MSSALQQNWLLGAISHEEWEKYFSDLDFVSLPLGKVIYETTAPIEYVYFIVGGIASILTQMTNGESVEAGMVGSEGVVGLPALLGRETCGQQVLVQAPLTALRMTSVDCKAAFDQSDAFRNVMLRYIDTLLDIAGQTAACNRLHSLKERFARWLLMMHDRLRSDSMPLTHDFVSSMLGVRRSRVTEAAGELQRSGLIRYSRGQVTILNLAELTASACECYRAHDRLLG